MSADPSEVVMQAAIKAAVSEGLKAIGGGAKTAWGKLRGFLGKWSGAQKDDIEESINDVVGDPEREKHQRGLAAELGAISAPIDPELVAAAEDLLQQLDSDPNTADLGGNISQIVKNLSGGSAAAQATGGGNATATTNVTQGEKKTPS